MQQCMMPRKGSPSPWQRTSHTVFCRNQPCTPANLVLSCVQPVMVRYIHMTVMLHPVTLPVLCQQVQTPAVRN